MAIVTAAKTPAVTAAPKRAAGRPAAGAAKPAQTAQPTNSGVAFVSLNPDMATQGGLIDDIDVEITDALAVMWDYNGNAPTGPAMAVEYTDVNGAQHIQYYSAGKSEDWLAHESGEGFVSVSGKTGFNSNSNIMMLFDSLVKAGFPKEYLTGNVKVIVGTKGHVLQHITERKGLIRTGKNADRPSSVLLVSKITELPAGVGGGGSGAVVTQQATQAATKSPAAGRVNGAAAAGAVTATTSSDLTGSDLDIELQGYLQTALLELPEGVSVIEKKDIVKIVFKKATEDGKAAADRNKAVIRAGQQDFLNGLSAVGISYTGTEISLAQ
jgi:hypothetical protein